ncbi:MAG: hypothetical protein AAGM22_08415 [Acidobacteriota bacterium]
MELTPQGEEQVWLVRTLGALIGACGWRRFVRAPILAPTAEFFPDASGGSEVITDRAARRLLHYADLGDVEVELEVTHPDSAVEDGNSPMWLVRYDDRRAVIGARADFAPDAEDIAGALSHVVADVFRRRHGLAAADPSDEGLEIEVTSVYLGFGILAANSGLRYQSGHDVTAGWAATTWQITSFGVLTPQALTYLLAVQCSARRLDKRGLREIRRFLEPNQATFFDSAVSLYAGKEELLLQSLEIPPIESWPVRQPVLTVKELPPYNPSTTRLVGFQRPEPAGARVPAEPVGRSGSHGAGQAAGQAVPLGRYPIFRVRRLKPYAAWGAIAAAVLAASSNALLDVAVPIEAVLGLALAGAVYGFFHAKANPYDVCSDPECESVLPGEANACPGCDRPIKGRIRRPGLRLDAEEKVLEEGQDWVEM